MSTPKPPNAQYLKSAIISTINTFSSLPLDQRASLRVKLQQLKKEAEQELATRTKGKEFLQDFFSKKDPTSTRAGIYHWAESSFKTLDFEKRNTTPVPTHTELETHKLSTLANETNKQLCERLGIKLDANDNIKTESLDLLWDMDDLYKLTEPQMFLPLKPGILRTDGRANIFMVRVVNPDGTYGVRSLSFRWAFCRFGVGRVRGRLVAWLECWFFCLSPQHS